MLTISQVSKTYDNGVKALNNVNLNIDKGMFGLLGPNGAGKSSLMRTVATLQLPDKGGLSTHIVDDVSELCGNMAVMGQGEILLKGNPLSVTDSLNGQIWRKSVQRDEVAELEQALPVISKRLLAGQTVLHVLADTAPESFESAPASLEDVYFSTLHQARRSQGHSAAIDTTG